jgi:hypothetical protein
MDDSHNALNLHENLYIEEVHIKDVEMESNGHRN